MLLIVHALRPDNRHQHFTLEFPVQQGSGQLFWGARRDHDSAKPLPLCQLRASLFQLKYLSTYVFATVNPVVLAFREQHVRFRTPTFGSTDAHFKLQTEGRGNSFGGGLYYTRARIQGKNLRQHKSHLLQGMVLPPPSQDGVMRTSHASTHKT